MPLNLKPLNFSNRLLMRISGNRNDNPHNKTISKHMGCIGKVIHSLSVRCKNVILISRRVSGNESNMIELPWFFAMNNLHKKAPS